MESRPGEWLTLAEYAARFRMPEIKVRALIERGELIGQQESGWEFVWAEAPPPAAPAAPAPEEEADDLPAARSLALRTDRALGLVEKSLNTFMLMHREVTREKERLAEAVQIQLREKTDRIAELERRLGEQEREIARLRQLAGVLDEQVSRHRLSGPGDREKGRALGDMMEEQLAYIMEQEMLHRAKKE